MSKEDAKYVLLLVGCVIALSRTEASETCASRLKKCQDDTKVANGLSREDITRILNEWRKNRQVNKEDNDRFCKYNLDLQACYGKLKGQCGNDTGFKIESSGTEMIMEMFNCGNGHYAGVKEDECERNMTICVALGLVQGKINLHQFQQMAIAKENRKYLIAQIGRVTCCDFVKTFMGCYDGIKDTCADDPKQYLSTTKEMRTQFRCGEPDAGLITKCEGPLNKCKDETMDKILRKEIDEIIWTIPGISPEDLISLIGKDRACPFVKNFEECHDKVKVICDENDLYFKPILDITKMAKVQFDCGCVNELNKCRNHAMTISEVTQKELDAVLNEKSDANRKKQFDKIGKERGCEFVEVFKECHDEIKNVCSDDDRYFRPFLDINKLAHDHLKCGCASAVASLFLLLASVFIVFYQKSTL